MSLVVETLKRGRVIVGHRGIPAKELENTLQSVEKALQVGVDIVEVDLQKTRDGILVLSHDESLERTFGEKVNIRQASWEELSKVRKGQYRVARLEEVLELVKGRIGLFLEIK
ncbi:MAG: glycerophosphodiester phosphodiesterase, partial [Aquificota bacterium]